jgi:hypothetical protein
MRSPKTLSFRALALASVLGGCESNALSLDDPTRYTASLTPDYVEGRVAEVVLTFDGIDAVSDPTGDPTTWQVAADDLGELYLEGFKFLSNFQVELDLATQRPGCDEETAGCERAALGQHALTLQISNHYGTFTVQTTVLVFP